MGEIEGGEGNQQLSSSKHVSQTRTGFFEDGVRVFLHEQSEQKMLPQCLQWCCMFTEEGETALHYSVDNVCPVACQHQSRRQRHSYLPDSHTKAFPTGHAVLHFVVLGPLPGQTLGLLDLKSSNSQSYNQSISLSLCSDATKQRFPTPGLDWYRAAQEK